MKKLLAFLKRHPGVQSIDHSEKKNALKLEKRGIIRVYKWDYPSTWQVEYPANPDMGGI